MPRYIVLVAPVGRWDLARTFGPVDAPDAEAAAALAAVEWFGEDARARLQAADPHDGIPCFTVGRTMFAVERLTP